MRRVEELGGEDARGEDGEFGEEVEELGFGAAEGLGEEGVRQAGEAEREEREGLDVGFADAGYREAQEQVFQGG